MNSGRKNILSALIFLGVGVAMGVFVARFYWQSGSTVSFTAVREGGYSFINPLLSCDISENKQFKQYSPIENKFQSYITQNIANKDATDISVYFRGLNSGYWSGVNENDKYSPASLLKVPIMIAYLKEADADPSILNQKIVYHETTDGNAEETFKPRHFVVDGGTYTIAELIQYMIAYSDNNAATYLGDHVDQNSLTEVYSDLGIPISSTLTDETMTPKIYSYVFRILYNATYLSKAMSQYALALLSTTDFSQGIKAGIPASVPSAQKFGERTVFNANPTMGTTTLAFRELHDCGVVYYPQNPYLLCVMTKGNDFGKLSKIISDISAMAYQETASGVLEI